MTFVRQLARFVALLSMLLALAFVKGMWTLVTVWPTRISWWITRVGREIKQVWIVAGEDAHEQP